MGISMLRVGRFINRHQVGPVALFCLLILVAVPGCSGKASAGAEATGVVMLDGAPLPNVLLSLYPTGGGSSAFATTDSEGKFTVSTSGAETGLAAGDYVVTVSPGDSDDAAEPVFSVPKKYSTEATTDLKISVSEGAGNDLKIELSSTK